MAVFLVYDPGDYYTGPCSELWVRCDACGVEELAPNARMVEGRPFMCETCEEEEL
jgi:formylmethanofuran dehydrogenase subunit E